MPDTPHDELVKLPSEREERRSRRLRLALLLSLLLHVVFVLLVIVAARVIGIAFLHAPAPPPSQEPEPVIVRFIDQRVKVPEPEPPDTNVIAEQNAKAASPGEGPAVPHGESTQPDPDAGRRGQPQPEVAPEPAAPPEPAPEPQPQSDTPSQAPREETPEEKRRRVADALGHVGSLGQSGDGGWGDEPGTPESGISYSFGGGGMQIESRSDVDWGPWARKVQEEVKGNWYSVMPVAARVGMKGIVVVRFHVHRDGTITDYETLESSGVPPLDLAVDSALLRMSSPLPPLPLPEDSDEEFIRLTYTFIYNLDDDREIRAWRRMNWQRQRAQRGG